MRYENEISPVPLVDNCNSASIVGFIGLGSWQLQRLQWKNDLISVLRLAQRPMLLPSLQLMWA